MSSTSASCAHGSQLSPVHCWSAGPCRPERQTDGPIEVGPLCAGSHGSRKVVKAEVDQLVVLAASQQTFGVALVIGLGIPPGTSMVLPEEYRPLLHHLIMLRWSVPQATN
eukprot:scaffold336_cov384-Prasinococcus_capsulatus_cf.AAC.24